MSTAREKNQKDYDLEQIVKVLDTALTSDNVAVKNALRSLLLVSTIVSSEHPDQTLRSGPLSRMFEDHNDLIRRLNRLEDELNKVKWDNQSRRVEPFISPNTIPGPYTGTGPYPNTTWTSTTTAGDNVEDKGASSISKTLGII